MKRSTHFWYRILYWIFRVSFFFYHPYKFIGRENLPEGAAVLCANHSGFADPLWVFMAMNTPLPPWTMAKKSVMDKPVFGRLLRYFGAFPVDREGADMGAVRKSLSVLKDDEKLLIFPEGTRIKKGKVSQPKSGTVMIANRAGAPLVPIYITHKRTPFCRVRVIIDKPYKPEFSSRRPNGEELQQAPDQLMAHIYALGEKGKKGNNK